MRRWLLQESDEPRRAPRSAQPEVIVHYWEGSAKGGREVRDISDSGAYIFTEERWYPGTIIRLVVEGQRMTVPDGGARAPVASICLASRVARHGSDGVAIEFVFGSDEERKALRNFLAAITVRPAGAATAATAKSRAGQALVEFALVLPLVFLLAVNAVNFGGFLIAWITVAGSARDGAEYMVSAASPTAAQIRTLILNDLHSLPNSSAVSAPSVCTNNSCDSLVDPEASYTLSAVDVTYTYNPFIPLFSFPSLGISATLPSSTIHQRVVMRMLR